MDKILLFVLIIVAANIAVYFLVPSQESYMFSIQSFGVEPLRYLTFQFFHVNLTHLIENIVGMVFVALLAKELNISFRTFLLVYFVSIFMVPLPLLVLFPQSTVAGNSTGIFGLIGLSLIRARKLVPYQVSVPIFVFIIFSLSLMNFIACGQCYEEFFKSDTFHFFGFLCGASISLALPFMPAMKAKQLLRSG